MCRLLVWIVADALFAVAAHGADVAGEVTDAQGKNLMFSVGPGMVVRAGDQIEVLAAAKGAAESKVASGTVTAVFPKSALAEVKQATGKVQPGQKVRIVRTAAAGAEAPVKPSHLWLGVSRWQSRQREVVLCGVLKDGPAGKAGLKTDDTILSIGGEPVRTVADFHRLLDRHRPGDRVEIAFERDGQQSSLPVTLEATPPDGGTARMLAAAEAGESWAMMEVGVRCTWKKDFAEAVRWFGRATEAGYTAGPLFLAFKYRDGTGVAQDYAEAKRLFEQARLVQGEGVRKGVYTSATYNLAFLYDKGLGTAEDPLEAFQLYHDAAVQGSLQAMHQVGEMCEAGRGVQKDVSAAIEWYREAAELGYLPAQKDLDRLAAARGSTPPGGTQAPRVDRIDIVERGIYRAEVKQTDAHAETGKVAVFEGAQVVEQTTTVPAKNRVIFGFRYVVVGEPKGVKVPVKVVTIFPEGGILNPHTGKTLYRTEDSKATAINGQGYSFRQLGTWGSVPGTWTFQLWYQGRQYAEQKFTLVQP